MSQLRWAAPLALFTFIGGASTTFAQGRGFQSQDLHQMRSVGEVQSSPDGNRVVYTVQYQCFHSLPSAARRTGREPYQSHGCGSSGASSE